MADLTVTPANVVLVSGSADNGRAAGEAFTAGMAVYLKTTTSTWFKAQCDGTAEEAGYNTLLGIALNTGVLHQPASVALPGSVVNMGATVAIGVIYDISAAAGGVAVDADIVTTGQRKTILGIGATAANLDMSITKYTGYVMP